MTTTRSRLIGGLLKPSAYPHPVGTVELVETHISWVLLAGEYAYKIKKPIAAIFLDFSTLKKRRFYCQEELRLNRKFAPKLYLGVIAITGSEDQPQIDGDGEAIEYAVQMQRFRDEERLDQRLADGHADANTMHRLGSRIASYHLAADPVAPNSDLGTRETVTRTIQENLDQLESSMTQAGQKTKRLDELKYWIDEALARLSPVLEQRRDFWARDCHGDLHLSNLVEIDGAVMAFDCIEFDPGIRCLDVVYDYAFLMMDLESRDRADLAHVFLDSYLSTTGDYAGVDLLPMFLVHTSLVRAKVAAMRLCQDSDETESRDHLDLHIDLASRYTESVRANLVITCGLSGSGKSLLSKKLIGPLRAVRLRSDVERKRIADLPPRAVTGSAPGAGLYTKEMDARTYARLADCASHLLLAGINVIVDAAFLSRSNRNRFRALAANTNADFRILWLTASNEELMRRVRQREGKPDEISEAGIRVLQGQMEYAELPDVDEAVEADVIRIDTSKPGTSDELARCLNLKVRDRYPANT